VEAEMAAEVAAVVLEEEEEDFAMMVHLIS
jgi:hypothetical protein